jgi:alcohol dehydrogenase (cytochrome c)/quinohemoprotein ethanol dehydrogenase
MRAMGLALALVAGLALAGCQKTGADAVDGKRIAEADQHPGDWLSYGRTYDEQRFSPLTAITDQNVGQLKLAWYADLDTDRGQEATPLEAGGVLYTSTAWSKVKAYDAKTGKLIWAYDPKVPGEWAAKACCDVVNRGVALWKGKVYVGTLDGRLIALDAKSGMPLWTTQTFDRSKSYAITGAPRIVKGKVIIGAGGAEFNNRGFVSAYDADTGKMVWRFWTVPGDPSKSDGQPSDGPLKKIAAPTWAPGTWKLGGGGTVWDAIVYDPELDLLYFGTDNGDPWNQGYRGEVGDNLFLTSIIAVRPDTGQYVWHYQVNPGDEWDYSATQPLMLADLTIDGKPRKVIMQAPKNGFFYVLDRTDGKLISAKTIVPINWATGIDMKTGRPILNPQARYSETRKAWSGLPGPEGAHNWNPWAFSPKTGLVYIPANETGFPYMTEAGFTPHPEGLNLGIDLTGGPMTNDVGAQKAMLAASKGYLLAWDPVKQQAAWRADRPGPANGGVVATAGNLVFQGSYAGEFTAYAADTGRKLWAFDAQAPIIAAPMTYQAGDEQYVAVLTCGGGAYALSGGLAGLKSGHPHKLCRVLAFKLNGTAKLPPVPASARPPLNPPPLTATEAEIQQGYQLYGHFCGICHGAAAVSAGILPDLRYTPLLASDSFFDVVLGGALKDQGMVSFQQVLTRDQAAAVRSYLIKRAHETQENQARGQDLSAG